MDRPFFNGLRGPEVLEEPLDDCQPRHAVDVPPFAGVKFVFDELGPPPGLSLVTERLGVPGTELPVFGVLTGAILAEPDSYFLGHGSTSLSRRVTSA